MSEFLGADELGFAEGVEEAVAEELNSIGKVLSGHAVEGAVWGEEAIGGKDVQVRMKDEVIPEGVDGGDGTEFPLGKAEATAKVIVDALDGGAEEDAEMGAPFAEDATEDLGDGEHELAVWDVVADGPGDPLAGASDAALMAGGAEVAALAGEGDEALVTALGAVETSEAGGEITATEEGLDGGGGVGAEWAEGFPVVFFVVGEEGVPAMVDELPERRGAGMTGLINGRHKTCS